MYIKKKVKEILDKRTGKKVLRLTDIPKSVDTVSFDIFDTLIIRSLPNPAELFRQMEKENGIPNFCEKRIAAERVARKKKRSREVTLAEIYCCFRGVTKDEVDALCHRELEAELNVCVANEQLLPFYQECIKDKRVILISDMYFPSEVMKQILDKCGIIGYEAILVSGEIGVSKRSKQLYRYVMKKYAIAPCSMVHVGNDFMADYLCAKRAGIQAIKIRPDVNNRNLTADQPERQALTEHTYKKAVLEVNVDDQNFGGVFALVKKVVINNKSNIRFDIAAIEPFDNHENIKLLRSFGSRVFSVGDSCGKLKKQFIVFSKLRKLIKDKGYNCVHIHADTANKLLISGLAAKAAGARRIILHSHAAGVDGNHRLMKKIIHMTCRRILRNIATDYVACSEKAALWMFPNVPLRQIKIIHNGIDLYRFSFNSKVRSRVRAELGITDEVVLGNVGRFSYVKNHEFMIHVFKQIVNRGINAKLLLVGAGECELQLRELAEKFKLTDKVIFFGTTSNVSDLLQAMDVFLFPSRSEGLGIAGIEAQATGLPVICSDRVPREIDFTGNVYFLPITNNEIQVWVDTVVKLIEENRNRYLTLDEKKQWDFDISSVVVKFLELYGLE